MGAGVGEEVGTAVGEEVGSRGGSGSGSGSNSSALFGAMVQKTAFAERHAATSAASFVVANDANSPLACTALEVPCVGVSGSTLLAFRSCTNSNVI